LLRDVAVNFFFTGSWTEQNLRNGYLIQIVPSASIQVTYNVKVRVSGERLMNGNNRYGKVGKMFILTGLFKFGPQRLQLVALTG